MERKEANQATSALRPARRITVLASLLVAWAGCQIDDGYDAAGDQDRPSTAVEQGMDDVRREPVPIHAGPAAIAPPAAPQGIEVQSCVPEDFRVPIEMAWPAVVRAGLAEGVTPSAIELRLQNNRDRDLRAHLQFTVDAGTSQSWSVEGPILKVSANRSITHRFDLHALPLPVDGMRTSGMVAVSAFVFDDVTGRRELSAASPPLFWHYGTRGQMASKASGFVTVYDERTLEQTYRGGDLMGDVPRRLLDEKPDMIPSRVITGPAAIVTQGSTTPADLVKMGLLDNYEAPKAEVSP